MHELDSRAKLRKVLARMRSWLRIVHSPSQSRHFAMALRQVASRALGCSGCQQWLLRSFVAGVGINPRTLPPVARPQTRSFSRYPTKHNEARERIQIEEHHVLNEINETAGEQYTPMQEQIAKDEQADQAEHVPWYLQAQEPVLGQENPIAARQKLPDLPEYRPDLLEPLLKHVSIELGMDDLSLLDLRTLDPPPALGANLIMIVGTARSEKHLHVSADRLCRWLRTEYKLSPYADGLLGRNELKLKMRRKAKRSKLLSSVGTKPTGETEIDDGIRTGWVCVNLGRIEGGELPEQVEKVQRAEGVVGFGARTTGCSIVVQMLTEEKREHLDLEKLWRDMLSRANREKAKEEESKNVESGLVDPPSSSQASTMNTAPA